MLSVIRNKAASFVAKILAGLLIISFGAWGVNDYISDSVTTAGEAVAEVGGTEISPYALQDEVRQDLRRMAPLFGNRLTQEQMVAMGLAEGALQRLITSTLLDRSADQLGVTTSDAVIAEVIRTDPNFQGLAGGFDRMRFEQLMQANGMTEASYVANMRRRIGREMVVGSVSSIGSAPKALAEALFRHRAERRVVETILIKDDAQTGIATPDSATLAKYHEDHKQRFTAPEYRKLVFASLKADDLAKDVAISEDELKEGYDAHQATYITPERRQILQIVLPDQATADQAASAAREGRAFADVAKNAGDANVVDLGMMARNELPVAELVEPAFAAAEGTVAGPVKSSFGWHLLKIAKVEAGVTRTLDDVRSELTALLAKEKAVDSLFEFANRLENITGGGATLEEAARDLDLKAITVGAVDRQGKTPGGTVVTGLPEAGGFLDVAFGLGQGEDSVLTESGSDGYFMVRVDGITAPVLRPLDTVRDEVARAWAADERRKAAEKAASAAAARVNGGATLADVAGDLGLTVETSKPFNRDGRDAEVDNAVRLKAFETAAGTATLARVEDGYKVVRVAEVKSADAVAEKQQLDEVANNLTTELQGDIAEQFGMALRESIGVTVNRRAVEFALGGGSRSY